MTADAFNLLNTHCVSTTSRSHTSRSTTVEGYKKGQHKHLQLSSICRGLDIPKRFYTKYAI